MKLLLLLIVCSMTLQSSAQNRSDSSFACMKRDTVLLKGITPAEFPGGEMVWRKWLEKWIDSKFKKYEPSDWPLGTYRCYFTVDTTGTLSSIGFCGGKGDIAENMLREIIYTSPLWKPAVNAKGIKVPYVHLQLLMFDPAME